ncbi:Rid family detoxifying hydrolase [Enterocloster sp. OA13]|uniref:RidA family protein n=1 Tax=Enterocloster TaxID=2719313 RepID=UPI000470D79A|nr:Rid family detoxifying hydrolase [Lachnoclostridium pacaense]MCC2876044.1 Rid family detoxifying hydrolase [Lachnoclostridium pacaense]MCH1948917.1 Rid family detoxifying hydrolase [Enterocloster sp. OA13]
MEKVVIKTDKAAKPGGWYSQAYKVGDLIYTAGITANDPVTQEMIAPGDIAGQTEQIIKNLKIILEEAGSDLEHVVKTLVFVKDIDEFAKFNEVYKQYFPNDPPARSTMQVGKFNGDMVIEIEAVAICR